MNELEIYKEAAHSLTEPQRKAGYVAKGMYSYTDEKGNLLFVRLRMDKPNGHKWIRPLSCDTNGKYQLKEPTFEKGTKPLYNLYRLANEPLATVYVVEGEKCADALSKVGFLTTTSGGADSARTANWLPLAGRDVVIWPDNDAAGTRYADDVTSILHSLTCNVSRVDVDLLELPHKGDCFDWIERLKIKTGKDATIADIDALKRMQSNLPLIKAHDQYASDIYPLVNLKCASEIEPEAIDWLWQGWLAKGKLHIFAGQAGTGKTTIAIAFAATISTGGCFPDGSQCTKGSVLIWSGEDSAADTLVPRLMAAGADLSKVHFVSDTLDQSEFRSFDPATDMQPLMYKAASIPDLALMIIDPIVNAVAGDSHKNGEVRRALQPVVDFGEKLKCAVLGITHFSKGGQGREPLERVTGSLAFGALARIVLATAKITEGENTKRIVCRAKSNIGIDSGGFEYDLSEKLVKEGIYSSYALWGQSIDGSARELLAEPDQRFQSIGGVSALDDAKDFLRNLLADEAVSQKQIQDDAKGAGHSWRTIQRAKKDLKIKSHKSNQDGCWYWQFGNNNAKSTEECQESQINTLANLAHLKVFDHIDKLHTL